jgi:hypothetical protein
MYTTSVEKLIFSGFWKDGFIPLLNYINKMNMTYQPLTPQQYKCNHICGFYYHTVCKFGYDCYDYQTYLEKYNCKFYGAQDCCHTDSFGYCKFGAKCNSAQTRKEKKNKVIAFTYNRKTMLCTNIDCRDKDTTCAYAHSEKERNDEIRKQAFAELEKKKGVSLTEEEQAECKIPTCREYVAVGTCSKPKCKFIHPEDREEIINILKAQKCNKPLQSDGTCGTEHCLYNHDPNFVPAKKEEIQLYVPEIGKLVTMKEKDKIVIDLDEEEEEEEVKSKDNKMEDKMDCEEVVTIKSTSPTMEIDMEEEDEEDETGLCNDLAACAIEPEEDYNAILQIALQARESVHYRVVDLVNQNAKERLLPLK